MTYSRASQSPTSTGKTGGALGREDQRVCARSLRTGAHVGTIEHLISQECPESFSAILISLHGGYWFKLEFKNDFHQKISRRHSLTVTEVRRVRGRDAYAPRELWISHSHVNQYVACLTSRQKVGHMDHNLKLSPDMDQALAALRDPWIRAQALSAAVAFRKEGITLAEYPAITGLSTVKDIINVAGIFETYIRDGKENSNAQVQ